MSEEEKIFGYPLKREIGKRKHTMLFRVEYDGKEAILAVFHRKYARDSRFLASLEQLSVLYKHLDHPNILKIHKWNIHEEPIYFLMEAYDKHLPLDNSIPAKQRRKYIQNLSDVLDFAHHNQFVHGNLSPDVLFLRTDGSLCVAGWGNSIFTSFSLTRAYLAPEETVGGRASDLYGMALISYQLFSGQLPWEDKCSLVEIEDRKRKQELRPLTAFGFPDSLAGVLNRALSNYPVNRYDSAGDIASSIQNPPNSAIRSLSKEKPPTIDLEKQGVEWKRDLKVVLPILLFFTVCTSSLFFFMKESPKDDIPDIHLRFKGKEQQTAKIEKRNRVEVSGIFFDFIEIPSGKAQLGPISQDDQARTDESVYTAFFASSFLLTQTEITQTQWNQVMGVEEDAGAYPKTNISWLEAVQFCNAFSKKMGKPEAYSINGTNVVWKKGIRGYRLPTEVEWEYAARGNESFVYAGEEIAENVSWMVTNSKGNIQAVAGKKANAFFLHDMSGNAAEWVWDWYSCPEEGDCPHPFPTEVSSSYRGPSAGTYRVIRGGSFLGGRTQSRVSAREYLLPEEKSLSIGFRIAY